MPRLVADHSRTSGRTDGGGINSGDHRDDRRLFVRTNIGEMVVLMAPNVSARADGHPRRGGSCRVNTSEWQC